MIYKVTNEEGKPVVKYKRGQKADEAGQKRKEHGQPSSFDKYADS